MRTTAFRFLLLLTLIAQTTFAQLPNLQKDAVISILTIGPGNHLNDSFGHSAFRIKNGHDDFIFDYGRYDFNTSNFYTKFAQGKLNYLMGKNEYKDFLNTYKYYNRSIKEQVLNLTFSEKKRLYQKLITNFQPENRAYLYDFFFDNCATRIRDVLNSALQGKVFYNNPPKYRKKTFRMLIQDNLNYNDWGSFGIDLALGSIIDQTAPAYDHMFLPENIHSFFGSASYNNKPLIATSQTVYKAKTKDKSWRISSITGPIVIMSMIGVFILFVTYNNYKTKRLSRNLDLAIFSITGLLGVFMLLLWFATDHEMTAYNYNLLWAMPLNLIATKNLLQNKLSLRFSKYMLFLILMLSLLFMHWILGVQRFAPALLPLIIALYIRFIYIMMYTKQQLKLA
jgi:hypothetical protein